MVYRIRITLVDCSKQDKAIRQILGQNRHLSNKIKILHIQWPKKPLRLGKTTTYLIINVVTPKQANTLIDKGLLF